MKNQHLGRQTVWFGSPPSIRSFSSVVGKKEGDGPLHNYFDRIVTDTSFGGISWEKSERKMQALALDGAQRKAGISDRNLDFIFAGDLLNQCIVSGFSARDRAVPYFGLYGACSTMAEGMALSSMAVAGGCANTVAAVTSSHFASAERQYRLPMEYGGQRTPTAQWTVTGAGALILGTADQPPFIQGFTAGKIVDLEIKDANNMGAAMAPAFADTLLAHFRDTGRSPEDYDLILSGDLGAVGKSIATKLLQRENIHISDRYVDCGTLIFDLKKQDVHGGGSGCGCSAAVLCGYILRKMLEGVYKNVLFCGTGALLSPVSVQQGESIPGICHAVAISMKKE